MPFCWELNSKVGCARISPPNENDEVYKCRTKNKNVIASNVEYVVLVKNKHPDLSKLLIALLPSLMISPILLMVIMTAKRRITGMATRQISDRTRLLTVRRFSPVRGSERVRLKMKCL